MKQCNQTGCPHEEHARGMCITCYDRIRLRRIGSGTWEPDRVDAQPVREHVDRLREAGLSIARIAHLAGISGSTVSALLYGQPCKGRGPYRQVAKATAERLTSVAVPERVDLATTPDDCLVPAFGTIRRLQSLAGYGYTERNLAARLGWAWDGDVSGLFTGKTQQITARRARQVAALFGQLQMVPGTNEAARARGAKKGWPLPLDWDEDLIDDPEQTTTRSRRRDYERSDGTRRNEAEKVAARRAEAAKLTRDGLSAADIAQRLRVTQRTVDRYRKTMQEMQEV
ncbi:helix-turn-helix domain-containing protein [Gordonia desulfuricans]|nr:helix-turn-helix domain-containing protein [Gordonia desulfuricans]